MADQQEAEKVVEEQQEPMPSSEETPQDSEVVEETSSEEESPSAESEPSLPEGTKERTTREFDKLKSQLAQERERRLRYERLMNSVPQVSQQPTWYNPETGMVEVDKLNNQFQQLQTAVKRYAEQDDKRQMQEAYKVHPSLDPNRDDFNEKFYDATVSYLASEYSKGKQTTLREAADAIRSIAKADVKKAEQAGAKKAIESLSPKEQASLEAESRSDKRKQTGTIDELRDRTRHGDEAAILERLKSLPPVGR